MKKSNIAMIILIASISVLVSYFVTKAIIGDAVSEPVKVKTAESISKEITMPDPLIFNKEAINPTVEVTIGNDKVESMTSQ